MTPEDVRRLVAFDHLANDQCLASLLAFAAMEGRQLHGEPAYRGVGEVGPPPRAVAIMAHIIGAERLWLARIEGEPSPLAVWPALDLDGCGRELTALDRPWEHLLAGLTDAVMARATTYTNSKGETFSNRVDDMLQHVFLHSAHHRGQIALTVRAAGGTPAYTDFIHLVRSGLISR
jgi:uncharacterized damage-inducible protein DinB